MEQTIGQGKQIAVDMQSFQPASGDLVVFLHEGVLLVKLVIGIAWVSPVEIRTVGGEMRV